MTTDWPGHGSTNRHVHEHTPCECALLFTLNNEPPWVYQVNFQPGVPPDWWNWMVWPRYLSPNYAFGGCTYTVLNIVTAQQELWQLDLMLLIEETEPDQIVARLRAVHNKAFQVSNYTNTIATGVLPGPRINRGMVWVFPADNWVVFQDEPAIKGPPAITLHLVPLDCIFEWSWGEPLPDFPWED